MVADRVTVVWFQQEGCDAQSQGQLRIGDDLKGELKSTTTLNNFNVIITAETDSAKKFPSEEVVLRARVQPVRDCQPQHIRAKAIKSMDASPGMVASLGTTIPCLYL